LFERQWNILKILRESPTITTRQMSEAMSVSRRTIERDLAVMREKGIIRREGNNNDGVWVVISGNK
jgi:ATP-dependent DNA helicase RecG